MLAKQIIRLLESIGRMPLVVDGIELQDVLIVVRRNPRIRIRNIGQRLQRRRARRPTADRLTWQSRISTVTLTARHRLGDAVPALTLQATFSSPTTGDFHFDVMPEVTKKLGAIDKTVVLAYDMQYTHQTTVITIVYGKLTILPEVTR
jgi:hypothetical protein